MLLIPRWNYEHSDRVKEKYLLHYRAYDIITLHEFVTIESKLLKPISIMKEDG